MDCSCPDWADMCKHVAAAMYGVGARLDQKPELLFQLRGVDPAELVAVEAGAVVRQGRHRRIAEENLSDVFGIELGGNGANGRKARPSRPARLKGR
jgi:uncharacterized Zn finger protein